MISSIELNPQDVARVRRLLAGVKDAAQTVLVRSLNKTLSGVKTDASAEIRAVVTAKKSAVDATFKSQKATATRLTAVFESTGRPIPLIDFGARQTQRGVSVQVRRDRPRSVIASAFVATMKSGHKGVFWRKWHQRGGKLGKTDAAIARSGYVFNRKRGRYFPIANLPKAYRLPIEQRFGPRIPDILSNEEVMAPVLAKADDRLTTNLEHELSYELSKL